MSSTKKREENKKNNEDDMNDDYVAIKIVGASDPTKEAYATREITILTELNHPHILKLIQSIDFVDDTGTSMKKSILITSFANGPNLERLRKMRGALSLALCRLIARQLISAVSYLHGRAVIHRDIKPANIILSRTVTAATDNSGGPFIPYSNLEEFSKDGLIFDDGVEGQKAVDDGRWKIVLVDFGFARALTPEEVHGKQPIPQDDNNNNNNNIRRSSKFNWSISNESFRLQEGKKQKSSMMSFMDSTTGNSLLSESVPELGTAIDDIDDISDEETPSSPSHVTELEITTTATTTSSTKEEPSPSSSSPPKPELSSSLMTRQKKMSFARRAFPLSAIGTKGYAAPEIKFKARDKTKEAEQNDHGKLLLHAPLTETIADYGMISDAYSVGITIREILTGVPADLNIMDYIASKTNPMLLMCSFFCRTTTVKQQQNSKHRYRYLDELPKAAVDLVRNLTRADIYQRIAVREAQTHVWIEGGHQTDDKKYLMPQGDVPSTYGHPVVFLQCINTHTQGDFEEK